MQDLAVESKIDEIVEAHPPYDRDGYLFLLEAIEFTVTELGERRHVSGRELLDGIREYGIKKFGPTTCLVFKHWGITETLDFGRMVFILVEHKLLRKTPEDSLEDFRNVYDFKEVFEDHYVWTSE